ncbi:MAG: hypothetical protein M0Q51_13135 [Bacteroidales bacterium]|nr:hypothetical protein [Bacteroidales bacterium]
MKKSKFNPVRKVIKKLKTINADPMKVCYGFAFGVFMSTTPLTVGAFYLVRSIFSRKLTAQLA